MKTKHGKSTSKDKWCGVRKMCTICTSKVSSVGTDSEIKTTIRFDSQESCLDKGGCGGGGGCRGGGGGDPEKEKLENCPVIVCPCMAQCTPEKLNSSRYTTPAVV
jgi:hypothetical protein